MSKDGIKRRFGDKRDGRLIRGDELDTNHFVMPLVWPRRTDNEAFLSETVDLTAMDEFIKEKNKNAKDFRYSVFMVALAAMGKTFLERPKMNRFYRNGRLYERYETSIGFIVKKDMTDDGEEALARINVSPSDTFETFCEKVVKQIDFCRSDSMDKSSDDLRILMKFPHFIGRMVMGVMKMIDKITSVPESISGSDMFFRSIVVTNLGSIKLHAGYHHLSNWGTNSFFVILGEKKVRPFYDRNGNMTLRDSIDIGFTIDERIADGYYFSKTIKILIKYLTHPELLEGTFLPQENNETGKPA